MSGFFGLGNIFAKSLATVGIITVRGQLASQVMKDKPSRNCRNRKRPFAAYLDVINVKIPTHAYFDVSMERGAARRITEIMYKALLRELGYAEDFDLADLKSAWKPQTPRHIREEFQAPQRAMGIRRKLGRGINEAGTVLNKLDQKPTPMPILGKIAWPGASRHYIKSAGGTSVRAGHRQKQSDKALILSSMKLAYARAASTKCWTAGVVKRST